MVLTQNQSYCARPRQLTLRLRQLALRLLQRLLETGDLGALAVQLRLQVDGTVKNLNELVMRFVGAAERHFLLYHRLLCLSLMICEHTLGRAQVFLNRSRPLMASALESACIVHKNANFTRCLQPWACCQ